MITFTIECSNFQAAAKVEKLLKEDGVRFETRVSNGHAGGGRARNVSQRRTRATNMTPQDVKEILGYCATHSDDSDKAIAKHFAWSPAVINRVRNGTHPLCKKA